MSEVILDMAMSLDGFAIDRKGFSFYPIQQLRGTHTLTDMIKATGAVVMDQETYDLAENDFSDYIYQVPIYVATESLPDSIAKGQNDKLKFHFVTGGIERAIKQARTTAKGKNVTIVGSVRAAQIALESGVVDLLKIRLINIIAGGGIRLFDHLSDQIIKLETLSTEEFNHRTDLLFKIVRYKYMSDESSPKSKRSQAHLHS